MTIKSAVHVILTLKGEKQLERQEEKGRGEKNTRNVDV